MNALPIRAWLVAFAGLAAYGCASTPPSAPSSNEPKERSQVAAPPATPRSAFEREQRERALSSTQRNRLAEAALSWEILVALRPDVDDYRERLSDTRQQIDTAVRNRLPQAARAAQRGEIEVATRQYLEVLALEPDNAPAADALRALEREHNKRSYLGKLSRLTITRAEAADAETPASASEIAGRTEVEHASLLADSGELDDAIALLEHHLTVDRRDAAARRLLAKLYDSKAESLAALDKPAAIAALKKSLQLNPNAPDVAERLKGLQSTTGSHPGNAAPKGQGTGLSPH